MGSVLQANTHGRPSRLQEVLKGEAYPHQLPQIADSNTGSENFPEGSRTQACPFAHKQPERDSLCPGNRSGQRAMDVVL